MGALSYVSRPDLLVDLHWTLAQCRALEGRLDESLSALHAALELPGLDGQHRARLLVLAARSEHGLAEIGEQCRVLGAPVLEVPTDTAHAEAVERLAAMTRDRQ